MNARAADSRMRAARAAAWLLTVLPALCAWSSTEEPRAIDPDAALRLSQAAIGREAGDYAFTDSAGKPVRLAQFRGKPVLVSFVYTGCLSVCPPTTRLLAQAIQKARGVVGSDAFEVISIGFNQPQDSPQAMRDFKHRFGLDAPNWKFLAPFEAQVPGLVSDLGFSYARTAWGFDHITQVTVLDQTGRVYRQVYGDDFAISLLVDPLKELIEGTPVPMKNLSDFVERVRILCTVYDPRTNTYRFKTTIIGEIVSFAAITLAIAWFVWRELRKRRSITKPGARA